MVVEGGYSGHKSLSHSGFVGLIGRPNVGKSTLVNQLAKRKLAIVSSKPQTTRHQIRAVITGSDSQLIFIDTPGFHKPKDNLGRTLNRKVRDAMSDVDVILFLLDGEAGVGTGDLFIAGQMKGLKTPVIRVVNKIDLLSSEQIDKQTAKAGDLLPGNEVIDISAAKNTGVDSLIKKIKVLLPPGPLYYPDDQITDQPEKVLMAEFIREKIINIAREELPYAVAVEINEVKKREGRDLIDVYARIHVERESQKGIVIGHQGQVLEKVGRQARRDIEKLLGSHIFLDLLVVVSKDWRKNERKVNEFGY